MDIVDDFIKTDIDNTNVSNTSIKHVEDPRRKRPEPKPRFDPCIACDGEEDVSKPATRRCVVFNHTRFDLVEENNKSLEERKGTEKDVDAIESYFTDKGFVVDVHHDLSHDEIKQVLNQYVSENNWVYFVCFVLTHGTGDTLCAKDQSYKYDTLFAPFMSENCKCKAKLFFINADQGNKRDIGNEICTDACNVPLYAPKGDDFLVASSSVPEFSAMSHEKKGSLFIQILIKQLKNNASNDDILTVLESVKKQIALNVSGNYGNVSENKGTNVQRNTQIQIPVISSTLRETVYI